MEEKERYKVYKDNRGNAYICDTIKNIDYKIYQEFVDLLNQQYKELSKLRASYQQVKEENQQLKQQLHDLPKKIVEEITNELSNNTSLYFEMRESTSAHCPNKEYEWFNYVRFRNYINAILKKFGGEDE